MVLIEKLPCSTSLTGIKTSVKTEVKSLLVDGKSLNICLGGKLDYMVGKESTIFLQD